MSALQDMDMDVEVFNCMRLIKHRSFGRCDVQEVNIT